jgi:diguanylate cyclase (GGDEF)-like protein/PAS domain S-box-containing protein
MTAAGGARTPFPRGTPHADHPNEVGLPANLVDARPPMHTQTAPPNDLTAQLAASEARNASLMRVLDKHVMVGSDLEGTITAFTRGAERMLGYLAVDLVGHRSQELLHDPTELARRADELGVETGLAVLLREARLDDRTKREWTYVHRDGHRIPVVLTVSGIYDDLGELTGSISVAEDDTSHRRDAAALATHASEQEALRTVATMIAGGAHPRAVFAEAAKHAALVLGSVTGAVFCLEASGDARLVGAYAGPGHPPLPIGALLNLDGPTASVRALRSGTSESAHYEVSSAGLVDGPELPLRSGAATPIMVDGRVWGVVSVAWPDASASDPEALPRLALFADLVSLAVTGSEAREQLSMVASTDHLTGLANQRTFSDRLEDEVRRARRYGRPLSLVLIDLDHFKLVNDTHGHDAGNRVLAELANRMTDLQRQGEIIARVGGEEFAWILPETDAAGALVAAERVRLAVAATPFPGVGRLTTSVGFCELADASSARELFRHADLALYWAKSLGRNTTFRYAPETLELLPPDEQSRRLEAAKTLAAVRALAAAVDAKDSSTQRHSERVAELAGAIARESGWDATRIALLRAAAIVHDVGKIAIPDQILRKAGRLTADEYEQIKPHPAIGARMVADLLTPEQATWIRHHHERFDGFGYPDGLAGTAIPEGARILAVADAWDAMTVARPYGSPRSRADALDEIERSDGRQLCPDAVAAFLALYRSGSLPGVVRDPVLEVSLPTAA